MNADFHKRNYSLLLRTIATVRSVKMNTSRFHCRYREIFPLMKSPCEGPVPMAKGKYSLSLPCLKRQASFTPGL